ncbi:DUF6504 family protein [Knoellia sp. p5-6-4]|uniref:DUF6504 family protein n=1 Tax=unclassified Knoellia TaxID=2618719 RepID=UPI0023DBC20D|nr:DUF6504 family protein [Knoellia sp. p5-6-4]MDF2143618.1 DUF6504 family protein [Knoellia sp. p5-6-4]
MVRRYEEPIEVRATTEQAVPGGATGSGAVPDAFVWRGRLYVVRQVLDHWKERRPWWRDALDERRVPAAVATVGSGPDTGTPGPHVGADVLGDARERQVWRVEASAGRMAGTGVYDLGIDPGSGACSQQWRLLRVAD